MNSPDKNPGQSRIDERVHLPDMVKKFTEIVSGSVAKRSGIVMDDNLLLLELNNVAKTNNESDLVEFANQNKDRLKQIVLDELAHPNMDPEVIKSMLELLGANPVMREIYAQFGKKYVLGGHSESTTDCVQVLRGSEHFRKLVDNNPIRYFSEGSDLVLHENLGKVLNVVDRKNFSQLSQYRPTADKIYVFALVKTPLYLNGKPNVTHLQIATDLQTDASKLAVAHASSDQGKVVIEPDVGKYLGKSHFERVYVVEIDLKQPYVKKSLEREPYFEVPGYHNDTYKRPHIYDIPLVLDRFGLISEDNKVVDIASEEKTTLDLISDNGALSYLTILTGIREGKIGNKQNIVEEMAFRTISDPIKHSLGLHQVTAVVMPLFNVWLKGVDAKVANALGLSKLWKERQNGRKIAWSEIVPFLTTYNISDAKYSDPKVSTICAYLLIKHLYEDQLLSAYSAYGETFYGLEEQPEALIALAAAYRSNMSVLVRGSQQYRVAEMAKNLGLIDGNFNFTDELKKSDEYKKYIDAVIAAGKKTDKSTLLGLRDKRETTKDSNYGNKFMVDGYVGLQTSFVAFMCYKKLYPKGEMTIGDFKKTYEGNLNNLLSGKVSDLMKNEYEKKLGKRPKLLMTEEELRGGSAYGLSNKDLKFANEGLWAIAHYRKMAEENWNEVNSDVDGKGEKNPIMADSLERRSYLTNETSKIPSEKIQRFYVLISEMPGNEYYKKFPHVVLAACFVRGLFMDEGKDLRDGKWVVDTKNFINEVFSKNAKELKAKMPVGAIPGDRELAKFCALSSIMSVDEVVDLIVKNKAPSPKEARQMTKLNDFSISFNLQKMRYKPRNAEPLIRYAKNRDDSMIGGLLNPDLNEKEKRESFPLHVFDSVKREALKRGFGLNFALVVTAMSTLECGWGQKTNRFNEPTLFTAANNILSIKYDTKQYSKKDFEAQSKDSSYYVYHTVEYFDPNDHSKSTEHYEAFRRYKDVGHCVKDFFDLIERRYPLTVAAAKKNVGSMDSNPETQKEILACLLREKYATDPEYSGKVLSLARSVEKILRGYGQLI